MQKCKDIPRTNLGSVKYLHMLVQLHVKQYMPQIHVLHEAHGSEMQGTWHMVTFSQCWSIKIMFLQVSMARNILKQRTCMYVISFHKS